VYEQTTMLKLPWPIETARVETVGSVRALPLGNAPAEVGLYMAWGDEGMLDPNRNVWVVAASDQRATISEALRVAAGPTEPASDGPADGVADQFALVDADLVVNYRIRDGRFEEWSRFASDARLRRGTLDMREKALKAIAMRDATQYLSAQPLNRLLSPPSDTLELELKSRIQTSFDAMKTGVEVISVTVPRLRPPGGIEAQKFLELSIATQNARKVVEEARSLADLTMSSLLGSREKAEEVSALITRYNDLQNAAQAKSSGPDAVDSEAIKSLRREIEQAISGTQAEVAAVVAGARAARWEAHMKARSQTAAVLGQAPAWEVDPELFQQRAVMRVLAETLPRLRVKFILGIDPARVRLGVDFQEPDAGLNIADYLQKPEG
jgi:regulator of protease activity HflC (stomatin/prohibitin superfamily)